MQGQIAARIKMDMSKTLFTIARCFQAAAFIALAGATPAMANASAQPTGPVAKVETASAILSKAPGIARPQGTLAMNVVLTCVRSGPRMVC